MPLELEGVEALLTRSRAPDVEHAPRLRAAARLLDEEESGMPELGELVAEVFLQRCRQQAAAEHVAIPQAAVLDQEPAVDPARGGGERLARRSRYVRA